MTAFPCTSCGACCRRINVAVEEAKPLGLTFPFTWNERGVCEKLGPDNKCTVYAERPTICNVAEMRKILSAMSDAEFYQANARACNQMQEEDGMGPEYRIPPNPALPTDDS